MTLMKFIITVKFIAMIRKINQTIHLDEINHFDPSLNQLIVILFILFMKFI